MNITHANFLIIDLEATCCDQGSVPREEMEIIEIGAVLQNSRTFEITAEFQSFVRPVRHPQLTAFCRQLTGIQPADVADAPLFPQALALLTQWRAAFDDALFCSWGNYDRNQFLQDCDFHRLAYPFGPEHLNLKAEFSRVQNKPRQYGLDKALRMLGLTFEGSHHRGLDDARNIARIVRQVCTGGKCVSRG